MPERRETAAPCFIAAGLEKTICEWIPTDRFGFLHSNRTVETRWLNSLTLWTPGFSLTTAPC